MAIVHLTFDQKRLSRLVTLSSHLESIQNETIRQVEDLIDKLKATSEHTEDMKNTEPIKWTGIMNTIKKQAEEVIINEFIYK